MLFAATEPLTVKQVAERSKTNATYEHLRTMLGKGRVKKTDDGRYYLTPQDELLKAELIKDDPVRPAAQSSESFRPRLVRTLREQGRKDAAEVTERLFAWADAKGYQEAGKWTASPGGSLRFGVRHNGRLFEVLSFGGNGEVQLPLQYMTTGPFADERMRREYLDRVGRIPGVAERCERWDKLTGWPCFPLEVLAEPARLDQFTEAVEWAARTVREARG